MDEDEVPPDALSGHASDAGGDDVAQGLLVLSGEVAKMIVVLSELDEASFSKVKPRLKIFRDLVRQLPEQAARTRRVRVIGFQPVKRRRGI